MPTCPDKITCLLITVAEVVSFVFEFSLFFVNDTPHMYLLRQGCRIGGGDIFAPFVEKGEFITEK